MSFEKGMDYSFPLVRDAVRMHTRFTVLLDFDTSLLIVVLVCVFHRRRRERVKEEIDIIAFDDNNICFVECKWQNSVNKDRVKEKLIAKSQIIKHQKVSSYLVISKEDYLNGFYSFKN